MLTALKTRISKYEYLTNYQATSFIESFNNDHLSMKLFLDLTFYRHFSTSIALQPVFHVIFGIFIATSCTPSGLS